MDFTKIKKEDLKRIYLGGTGEMYDYKNTFLFKPALRKYSDEIEPFRGIVQECAYKVQKLIDDKSSVYCKYVESDYLIGTFQERIKVKKDERNYYHIQDYDEDSLSKEEIDQFMREFITDYLLKNCDSHGKNFVTGEDGIIRGIDKEQSFKFINKPRVDFLDIYTNQNESYGMPHCKLKASVRHSFVMLKNKR